MTLKIFVLEDDADRIERFRLAIRQLDHRYVMAIWSDARAMVRDLSERITDPSLISLDHDLYPVSQCASDPDDGLMVARFLASQTPLCPVIIHSSNSERARLMLGELQLGNWVCERLLPFGEDWIEKEWAKRVRQLIEQDIDSKTKKVKRRT